MRRSLLFIPANSPAMLQNADIFEADSIIFDLEDAVSFAEKDAALTLLDHYLKVYHLDDLEIVVRINALDTPYGKNDLEIIISEALDTIMLPKASEQDVLLLSSYLDNLEQKKNMSKSINIIPIIERASSMIQVNQIACCPRVNGLLLGAEDLATDLEVERTESGLEILFSRSMLVLAAKANRIDAIDTPYTDTTNEEGLISDCMLGKSLGMNAKVCIHPNQIDPVNEAFSPKQSEIDFAKKVLIAFEQAKITKVGVFAVDGKMIDKPIIERAEKLIEKAKKWKLV
ncbi:MAG: CoA ester lyase [Acholeplasmataceae bacterium]|nr:CoA ester lyase [Acholeplasmataceae bacterium]